MKHPMRILQGLKLAAVLAVALSMGACANKNAATDAMANAATPGSQQDFVVNVGDRVFFETDRYDLTGEAQSQLQKQAAWLAQYPATTVTVEGHCDERGTREYNLALGERRANAVRNYLVAQGVDPNRIQTISYGKERPEIADSNESAWAQNRRGVTVLQ